MAPAELAQLAALILGGIALVLVAIHLTGGSRRARFTDESAVRAAWALDDLTEVASVTLSEDRTAALLTLADGSSGVLFSAGDRWVARRLGPTVVIRERDHGLELRLGDLTAPRVTVQLADPERRWWIQHLET